MSQSDIILVVAVHLIVLGVATVLALGVIGRVRESRAWNKRRQQQERVVAFENQFYSTNRLCPHCHQPITLDGALMAGGIVTHCGHNLFFVKNNRYLVDEKGQAA